MLYINFCFENIVYDDDFYIGSFKSPDVDVYCDFEYNRKTQECTISNCNKPAEEILPLPVRWLDKKLKENGTLRSSESRICY